MCQVLIFSMGDAKTDVTVLAFEKHTMAVEERHISREFSYNVISENVELTEMLTDFRKSAKGLDAGGRH